MIECSLVFGGRFEVGSDRLQSDDGTGCFFFKIQKQQMKCILKFLDYSTDYTKFQTGVLKTYLENKYTHDETK
jgi:hypothetical protein